MKKINFRTDKDGVTDLTPKIREIVETGGKEAAACVIFTPHTTAGITITSFWDNLGHEDIQDEIRRLIPTRVDFKHQHDTPEDAAGHVKSVAIGVSLTCIIDDGKLALGHSQGIYFLEFDGPRNRECYVQFLH